MVFDGRDQEEGWWDTAQICLNGHVITSASRISPELKRQFCDKCGAATITECPKCGANIPGYYHVPGELTLARTYKLPKFCRECGAAYPWTESSLKAGHELALEEARPEEQREQEPKTSTTSDIVQRAALILKEEIADGIAAERQVEKHFTEVSQLHSGKPDEVIQRFRRDSHEPVHIPLDKFDFVETILDSYKDVTVKALLALLPRKEPRLHLYNLIPSYPRRAGKGFRPGLCIATCRAFGGDVQSVLRSAVAIEMFHNAFLIHDDLEDGSEYRRGKPTLHAKNGIGIAVNVGDAMNVLSIGTLMENIKSLGAGLTWQIFDEIKHMAHQSVEGQAMELGWVRDNICELSTEDYLRMTLKKTCWYTCIHPCRIGALIGTGGDINPERFNRFGYYMGAAFQIQDDILNLVGDRKKYGKEIGGDIWEGKRTMMLIHVINSCTESEKERMRLFLCTPRKQRLDEDVRWVYQLISKYDAIEFSRKCARQLAEGALREFRVAYGGLPESEDRLFIENIVLYMIEREL
jgi:geranylgeranyl diphosphate synthase type II